MADLPERDLFLLPEIPRRKATGMRQRQIQSPEDEGSR